MSQLERVTTRSRMSGNLINMENDMFPWNSLKPGDIIRWYHDPAPRMGTVIACIDELSNTSMKRIRSEVWILWSE